MQLRHRLAEELIHGDLVAEWQGEHGLHAVIVLSDGRVVAATAYHDVAHFAVAHDWPPDVLRDVAAVLHMPATTNQ